jgi:hypothetical protein
MPGSLARSACAVRSQRANARLFHHSIYPQQRIAKARERRGPSVSVCLPARECAHTVGEIVRQLRRLRDGGALDEIAGAGTANGGQASARAPVERPPLAAAGVA